jgi:hypothetical protein
MNKVNTVTTAALVNEIHLQQLPLQQQLFLFGCTIISGVAALLVMALAFCGAISVVIFALLVLASLVSLSVHAYVAYVNVVGEPVLLAVITLWSIVVTGLAAKAKVSRLSNLAMWSGVIGLMVVMVISALRLNSYLGLEDPMMGLIISVGLIGVLVGIASRSCAWLVVKVFSQAD